MDARTPVIIGVGQVNDRPAQPESGLDPLALMEQALRRADADAGGVWLADIDALSLVARISFPDPPDLSAALAARLGAVRAAGTTTAYPGGDSPVRLLNEAANRIAAGEIRIAAIAGAEALRTAATQGAIDATRAAAASHASEWRRRYGLVAPTDIYPLYENATRAAWGQTLAEAQAETGEIWRQFSEIAAGNEHAWLRTPLTAEAIVTPSPQNRRVAFPYTKLMVANAAVNQGAGFLVTSLAEARARGVPQGRLVYPCPGAAASESEDPLARDRYDRSASLEVSIRRALALSGLTVAGLDVVELYSCFPCIPKMARRALGWPLDRPASVIGGLTFAGGPIGNTMSHAIAGMVERLRGGAQHGLLFANGGYATHNHAMVLSSAPIETTLFPRDFDFQPEAAARRGAAPEPMPDYTGPATIETYTVLYDRNESATGAIVARTPAGGRTLARTTDPATLAFLTDGRREPVGAPGTVAASGDDRVWHAVPP